MEEFARGRYWQVHECWERGWTQLPAVLRRHVQSLIQGASVLHLLERGRVDAARRLARRALHWRSEVSRLGGLPPGMPHPEIDGLFTWLEAWLAAAPIAPTTTAAPGTPATNDEWIARAKSSLAARVITTVASGAR